MLTPDNFKILPRRDISSDNKPVQDDDESRPKPLPPNRTKDFKEVLDDRDEKPHLVDEKGIKKEKIQLPEKKSDKKGLSLFDLARSESNQNAPSKEVEDALSHSSSALQSQLLTEEEELRLEKKKLSSAETSLKKEKMNNQFTLQSPDISFLDPLSAGALANNQSVAPLLPTIEQTQPVLSPIHEIVTELIDKLVRVEMKGQTDTILVINKEGMFKDAIIVISEFETANGQLNLAFENLKNEAKLLLDTPVHREALMDALATKGYTITQLVTTTIVEHRLPTAETETSKKDPQQESEEGKQKKENKESQ